MPKISTARNAQRFIAAKCEELIGKRGKFVGFMSDVSDDGRVICYAYYVAPKDMKNAITAQVTDKDVIRAIINPATVPADWASAEEEEEKKPAPVSKK